MCHKTLKTMSAKDFSSASMPKFTRFFDYSKKYLHYSLVITLITVSCLWSNVDGLVGDDGAFFLKYAENMTKGYFWYYNIEQSFFQQFLQQCCERWRRSKTKIAAVYLEHENHLF